MGCRWAVVMATVAGNCTIDAARRALWINVSLVLRPGERRCVPTVHAEKTSSTPRPQQACFRS